MYDPKPFYTADGVKLEIGMTAWVLDLNDQKPISQVVETIGAFGRTVIFKSGEGWRVNGVFSTKEAVASHDYNSRVHLTLDEDDACLIHHALCKRLAEVQSQLSLLRIANDRDLTRIEREMLPFQLCRLSREELAEQIDPWITLESRLQYRLEDIEDALKKVER